MIPLAVRLAGALDRAALAGALSDLLGRHESLRTVFPERLGWRGRRCCRRLGAAALEVVASSEAELAGALSGGGGRGFDLSRELPLRAHLFELGAQRAMCCCCSLHHIAGDGWSLRPLLRDLCGFYRARRAGVAAALPALPVQYADYTLWQRAVLGEEADAGSAMARQLRTGGSGWRDLPEQIELPADRARPAVSSHRGGSVGVCAAGGSCTGGLSALARALRGEPVHGAAGGRLRRC